MGLQIESGSGNGKVLEINDQNRLLANCVVASPEHHANIVEGDSYSVNFSATPTGPGDCFLYMKNEDDRDMVLEGVGLYLAATEYFEVYIGQVGAPVGGTTITPTNLNAGSGNTADGTFENGNDITGMSGGSLAYRYYHLSANETTYHNFEQDIVIPKNYTATVYIQTGTTALNGFIDVFYQT